MAVKPLKINIKTPTPSAADRMYAKHQAIRKERGLPDPSEYQKKDMDNNPDNPDAGKYYSGSSKSVRKVTSIASPIKEADETKADQMTTDDQKFPKKMSRKAEIVRTAAKKMPKEDQFQAKPVLDSDVNPQTNKQ